MEREAESGAEELVIAESEVIEEHFGNLDTEKYRFLFCLNCYSNPKISDTQPSPLPIPVPDGHISGGASSS